MLWEIEIRPGKTQPDSDGNRVLEECQSLSAATITSVASARSFLIESTANEQQVLRFAERLLADSVVETLAVRSLPAGSENSSNGNGQLVNVLLKPGVTDNVGSSTKDALENMGLSVSAVATCRKYWFNDSAAAADIELVSSRVLANDAIEQIVAGDLQLDSISVGSEYTFNLKNVRIREMDDAALEELSRTGQLYLSLEEMRTIRQHFVDLGREPTDIELETVAQTWSEHCSHKTLAGRIHYRETKNGDVVRDTHFENMLKETIFNATVQIREELGDDDWCVSVFKDNAGIVTFDENENVCFKVETHNHPSALEPYGGANTGIGGVIRDPLGTGLGARPVCNTDVFCFAPLDSKWDELPPGCLHPQVVARGVVSGVRDYGNRMGIPTVNGSVFFDERYVGNPLVYCGNVAMIPVDKCEKKMQPGDFIVAVGGRTGRDGIHGATFSSAELTEDSEMLSGGAVQIGNAITEKMVADVILQARDRDLYSSITDCGAGGFSSAVGEMGEETGAEVWLETAPLKYSGLSYTEIWISEAQERMVLAVPPENWEEFQALCAAEGVEASVIGKFTDDHKLTLKYRDHLVGELSMEFLHDGRPPVIRDAVFEIADEQSIELPARERFDDDLNKILSAPNVASKEWIIRQYDHEVQSGSVVKPLVGASSDGPSDAAIVRPNLNSNRGLVISNGMNPCYGDHDPYWMAASAIDEALRNCVAVGADPKKIAILDNFCWGNTERAETLGTLVRAAVACEDFAKAFGTPFISGKDSLNNEFSWDSDAGRTTITIPSTLLISALGQIGDIETAVTMDLKEADNRVFLIGATMNELGGSHFARVNNLTGGSIPKVDAAAAMKNFSALHAAIQSGLIRSCHDLSEGGLAVAAAEMAFAGEFGLNLDLDALSGSAGISDAAVLLYSESNSRFLIEVSDDYAETVRQVFADVPFVELGRVQEKPTLEISLNGATLVGSDIFELKQIWKNGIRW